MVAIKAREEIREQELLPTTQQEIFRNNVELELLRNKTLNPKQEIDFDHMAQNGAQDRLETFFAAWVYLRVSYK